MKLDQLNAEVINCRKCPRLVEWRERVAREKRRAYKECDYWGKPVPGFGDPAAVVFAVGLAPGAHGSNRTGRQFTGDASGDFLYPALYRAGFASQPTSISRDDGMLLKGLYTSPICHCAPPGNKPTIEEMKNCQTYLEVELNLLQPRVIVALGQIAFNRLVQIYSLPMNSLKFSHNCIYLIHAGTWLVGSYHPSRQNTQTRRLTKEMFDQTWMIVRELLSK
jgi:uracil-DNA glycosylase family 4